MFKKSEIDDLLNCISIAQGQLANGLHKDSPNFKKAVEKLRLKCWREYRKLDAGKKKARKKK